MTVHKDSVERQAAACLLRTVRRKSFSASSQITWKQTARTKAVARFLFRSLTGEQTRDSEVFQPEIELRARQEAGGSHLLLSRIYLILQHLEKVMKAPAVPMKRTHSGEGIHNNLVPSNLSPFRDKKEERNNSTGRSVNKSDRGRTSFKPTCVVSPFFWVCSSQPFDKTKGCSATF